MADHRGIYYDVIWESLDNSAMATWFNGTGWKGWVPPGTLDEDGNSIPGNRFDRRYLTVKDIRKSGKAIVAMRLLQSDWVALAALNPPGSAFKIWKRRDPFIYPVIADEDNPTEAELYSNDVFWHISQDSDAIAAIRFYWPRVVDLRDEGSTKIGEYVRGLKFCGFGLRRLDHVGIGEV